MSRACSSIDSAGCPRPLDGLAAAASVERPHSGSPQPSSSGNAGDGVPGGRPSVLWYVVIPRKPLY